MLGFFRREARGNPRPTTPTGRLKKREEVRAGRLGREMGPHIPTQASQLHSIIHSRSKSSASGAGSPDDPFFLTSSQRREYCLCGLTRRTSEDWGGTPMAKQKIAIACQGGGSQTAFTAGVLSTFFEQGLHLQKQIVSLSGTSGGAVNASLAWYGLLKTAQGDPVPIQNFSRPWIMSASFRGSPPISTG